VVEFLTIRVFSACPAAAESNRVRTATCRELARNRGWQKNGESRDFCKISVEIKLKIRILSKYGPAIASVQFGSWGKAQDGDFCRCLGRRVERVFEIDSNVLPIPFK
jgi:hypothetical protein